jgi:hypothetical protein
MLGHAEVVPVPVHDRAYGEWTEEDNYEGVLTKPLS